MDPPLVVWRHHLAPTVLVFLFHIAAYLILDRLVLLTLLPWLGAVLADPALLPRFWWAARS